MARRVLITDADDFMGPGAVVRFRASGDDTVATNDPLMSRDEAIRLVAEQGPFDVVVVNLECPITVAPVTTVADPDLDATFDRLVKRLFWIVAAALPHMIEQGRGAIVVPTSATAIRSSSHPISVYESARAAQTTFVRSVGAEVARHGVRVNAVAPNYIENPSYFPPATVADPDFQLAVRRSVPAQRLGTADEAAAIIEFLASESASYLFGAVIPVDGGWTLGG